MLSEIKKLIEDAADSSSRATNYVEYDDDRSVAICMGEYYGYVFRALELVYDIESRVRIAERKLKMLRASPDDLKKDIVVRAQMACVAQKCPPNISDEKCQSYESCLVCLVDHFNRIEGEQ